jgi:hypothetical protein
MQFSDKQDWAIHITEKDSSLSSSTLVGEVKGHGGTGAPNRRQRPPVAPVLQAQAPSSSCSGAPCHRHHPLNIPLNIDIASVRGSTVEMQAIQAIICVKETGVKYLFATEFFSGTRMHAFIMLFFSITKNASYPTRITRMLFSLSAGTLNSNAANYS